MSISLKISPMKNLQNGHVWKGGYLALPEDQRPFFILRHSEFFMHLERYRNSHGRGLFPGEPNHPDALGEMDAVDAAIHEEIIERFSIPMAFAIAMANPDWYPNSSRSSEFAESSSTSTTRRSAEVDLESISESAPVADDQDTPLSSSSGNTSPLLPPSIRSGQVAESSSRASTSTTRRSAELDLESISAATVADDQDTALSSSSSSGSESSTELVPESITAAVDADDQEPSLPLSSGTESDPTNDASTSTTAVTPPHSTPSSPRRRLRRSVGVGLSLACLCYVCFYVVRGRRQSA